MASPQRRSTPRQPASPHPEHAGSGLGHHGRYETGTEMSESFTETPRDKPALATTPRSSGAHVLRVVTTQTDALRAEMEGKVDRVHTLLSDSQARSAALQAALGSQVEDAAEQAAGARRAAAAARAALEGELERVDERVARLEAVTGGDIEAIVHRLTAARLDEQQRRMDEAVSDMMSRISQLSQSVTVSVEELIQDAKKDRVRMHRAEERLAETQQQLTTSSVAARELTNRVGLVEESVGDLRRAAEAAELSARVNRDKRAEAAMATAEQARRQIEELRERLDETMDPHRRSMQDMLAKVQELEQKTVSASFLNETMTKGDTWDTRCSTTELDLGGLRKELSQGFDEASALASKRLDAAVAKERAYVADMTTHLQNLVDEQSSKWGREVEDLRDAFAQRQLVVEERLTVCEDGNVRLKGAEERLRSAYMDLEQLRVAHDQLADDHRNTKDAVSSNSDTLREVGREAREANARLDTSIAELRSETQKATERAVTGMRDKVTTEVNTTIAGLKASTETSVGNLDNHVVRVRDLVDELSSGLTTAQQGLQTAAQQLGTLQGDVGSCQGVVATLQKEVGTLQSDCAQRREVDGHMEVLTREVLDVRSAVSHLEKELDTANDYLQDSQEAWQQEISRLRWTAEEHQEAIVKAGADLKTGLSTAERQMEEKLTEAVARAEDGLTTQLGVVKADLQSCRGQQERLDARLTGKLTTLETSWEESMAQKLGACKEEVTTSITASLRATDKRLTEELSSTAARLDRAVTAAQQSLQEHKASTDQRLAEATAAADALAQKQEAGRREGREQVQAEARRVDRELGSVVERVKVVEGETSSQHRDLATRLQSTETAVKDLHSTVYTSGSEGGSLVGQLRELRAAQEQGQQELSRRVAECSQSLQQWTDRLSLCCTQYVEGALDGGEMPDDLRHENSVVQAFKIMQRTAGSYGRVLDDIAAQMEACTENVALSVASVRQHAAALMQDAVRDCAMKLEGQQVQFETSTHLLQQQVKGALTKFTTDFDDVREALEAAKRAEEKRTSAASTRFAALDDALRQVQDGLRNLEQNTSNHVATVQHSLHLQKTDSESTLASMSRQLDRHGTHVETIITEEGRKWSSEASALSGRVDALERELQPQAMLRRFREDAKQAAAAAARAEIEPALQEQRMVLDRALRQMGGHGQMTLSPGAGRSASMRHL
uniref:Uncharacterized protein n=1 Tax=Oxyrrhis marina TaxID=2969 RepID=A0A7S4LQ12_OXYMA